MKNLIVNAFLIVAGVLIAIPAILLIPIWLPLYWWNRPTQGIEESEYDRRLQERLRGK